MSENIKTAYAEASENLVRLGKTDLFVSKMGVGTMPWGKKTALTMYGGTSNPQDEKDAFDMSRQGGINFFDTAAMYGFGNSEIRVGELVKGTDTIVATKWSAMPYFTTSANIPKALEQSLKRLDIGAVDLYQIHNPIPYVSIRKMMERMADAHDAGKIRAVGVSNFSEAQMREAHAVLADRGIPLASNQIQYSVVYRRPEFDGVLNACWELGITPLAYMPLGMGVLTGKYNSAVQPKDFIRRKMGNTFNPAELQSSEKIVSVLKEIGQAHDATPGQVALRWIIDQGVIPIPGAKNARQATENAKALTFELSGEEIKEISKSATAWIQPGKWVLGPRLA